MRVGMGCDDGCGVVGGWGGGGCPLGSELTKGFG